MTEKPWKDLTPTERSQRMREGKAAKVAQRAADEQTMAAAPPRREVEPVKVPDDLFGSVELSDDEVADIYARARVKVAEEQKARKREAMMAAALDEARRDAGLIVTDPVDAERERLMEIVSWTVNLPEGGAPDGVRLDQMCYRHGLTYRVTRAVYETGRDIENRAWMAEAMFDGKVRNHYNKLRGRFEMAYGGGIALGTRQYHAGGGDA